MIKTRHFPLFAKLLLASTLMLSGCVLPPDSVEPRILDRKELSVVSKLSLGKDYAQGGRMDLAEGYLRKALELSPNSGNVMNDLGFVLAAQGRNTEAERLFTRAVALEPNNLAARDNLARLYYKTGDFVSSIREYQELVDKYYEIGKVNSPLGSVDQFRPQLASAYRNLALLYSFVGLRGEAFCYADRAFGLNDPSYTIVEHGRYLLSQARPDLALSAYTSHLATLVTPTATTEPEADELFDLGIANLSLKDIPAARTAFVRIPALSDTTPQDRARARVMKILVAKQLQRTSEIEGLIQDAKDDKNTPCDVESLGDIAYWPPSVVLDTTSILNELCLDEQKPLFKLPSFSF